MNKDYQKSIAALRKAYELDATQITTLFEIATIYDKMPDGKSLALKYYTLYLKIAKGNNNSNSRLSKYSADRKKVLKGELNSKDNKK